MKGALFQLMNQVMTLALSTRQGSAGDRLDPFILHTVLILFQCLTVDWGNRACQRTEQSSHFQSPFYLVGLLFFLSFFSFFNHCILAKVKSTMQEKEQSWKEKGLLKGGLLISSLEGQEGHLPEAGIYTVSMLGTPGAHPAYISGCHFYMYFYICVCFRVPTMQESGAENQ